MNTEELQNLSDGELATLDNAIGQEQAVRIARRNESLPDYPVLIPVGGHNTPIQVSRERAIELLGAHTHVLANEQTA